MAFFSTQEFNSLHDLFINQIEDLYDAENRIVKALPKMIDAASNRDLKTAFETHLRETQGHVDRLDAIFRELSRTPTRETCEAMKGLIQEGEEMVNAKGDSAVRDAALIAAAQRVEHYEIASYGTARAFARQLGLNEPAQLLDATLHEEEHADKKL